MFGKKKNEDDTEKVMKVSADNLTMITIGTIVKGIITIAGGLHLEGTLEFHIILTYYISSQHYIFRRKGTLFPC